VQTAFIRVPDIHVGTLSYALEALEFLDLGSVVSRSTCLEFFVVVRVGRVRHEKAVFRGKMDRKISRETVGLARVNLIKIRGPNTVSFPIKGLRDGKGIPLAACRPVRPGF
jgi:hypothetical protein